MAYVRTKTHEITSPRDAAPRIRGLFPLPNVTAPIFAKEILPAIAVPVLGGLSGGIFLKGYSRNEAWYKLLRKPSWAMPDTLVGPVWAGACAAMGYASWMVYRQGNGFAGVAKTPLMLYGATLLLDWTWAPVFFGLRNLGLTVAHTAALWGALAATAAAFHPINNTAGYLMLPAFAATSWFAAQIFQTWCDNPNADKL